MRKTRSLRRRPIPTPARCAKIRSDAAGHQSQKHFQKEHHSVNHIDLGSQSYQICTTGKNPVVFLCFLDKSTCPNTSVQAVLKEGAFHHCVPLYATPRPSMSRAGHFTSIHSTPGLQDSLNHKPAASSGRSGTTFIPNQEFATLCHFMTLYITSRPLHATSYHLKVKSTPPGLNAP